MTSSACSVLIDEPTRFIDYVFSDPKLRKQIVDKKSFAEVLERALRSDPTLVNIVETIKGSGESFEVCGANIFQQKDITDLVNQNLKTKKTEFRKRIRKQHPEWKRGQMKKELERRVKIFVATQSKKVGKTKQVTIQQATQPVRVTGYERAGKTIHSHRKTKYRALIKPEKDLITAHIKKGKTPSETAKAYYDSGLTFRTETSIKRHYYRMKDRLGI